MKTFLNQTKAYIKTSAPLVNVNDFLIGDGTTYFYLGEYSEVIDFIKLNQLVITDYYLEINSSNQLLDLFDYQQTTARIEPGAIIRKGVQLSNKAVVLMGAVINVGAQIDDDTMIDMNAVVGSNAIIGKRCHIGAGAVIAGVLEPMNHQPVLISDDVFIGANATILGGVKIGHGAVVGAGAVVTKDVLANQTVAGVPARVINVSNSGWERNDELRKQN